MLSTVSVTNELLKKYDVPGPRYTSYPTVPYWEKTPTADEWVASVARSLDETERSGEGASVYVHIPFCRSLCTYCGCNSRITQNRAVGEPYVRTVLREWELYRQKLGRSKPIPLSEMHFGGGTPTFLSPAELDELVSGILSTVERTNYLSELRAGSKVLAVDTKGRTRLATVGRVKIETRPLLSVDAVAPNGQEVNLILQDDWHVRVLGPGAAVLNSTELKPGDKVLGYLPTQDRHVGYPIDEFCHEQ